MFQIISSESARILARFGSSDLEHWRKCQIATRHSHASSTPRPSSKSAPVVPVSAARANMDSRARAVFLVMSGCFLGALAVVNASAATAAKSPGRGAPGQKRKRTAQEGTRDSAASKLGVYLTHPQNPPQHLLKQHIPLAVAKSTEGGPGASGGKAPVAPVAPVAARRLQMSG